MGQLDSACFSDQASSLLSVRANTTTPIHARDDIIINRNHSWIRSVQSLRCFIVPVLRRFWRNISWRSLISDREDNDSTRNRFFRVTRSPDSFFFSLESGSKVAEYINGERGGKGGMINVGWHVGRFLSREGGKLTLGKRSGRVFSMA